MGRSLNLYAIPDQIVHDPSKRLCMNWDFERTYEESKDELHEHLNKGKTYANWKEEKAEHDKLWDENQPVARDTKDFSKIYNPDWCPWCATFCNHGLYESPIVKGEKGFSHSYSNPIWSSDWHFYRMHPGTRHTDMVNRFSSERLMYEVNHGDIADLRRQLSHLGTAYCTADREALEETEEFITFCEKWLKEPGTIVLYDSET